MALTRKFLKALGLSEQSVQAILQAHTQALEALRASLPQTRAAGGSRGDGTAAPATENDTRPLSTRAQDGALAAPAAENDTRPLSDRPENNALAASAAGSDTRPLSTQAQDDAPAPAGDDEGPEGLWRQKYEALQREFEAYRAGVAAQRAQAARELAARAWYQSQGITGAALRIALRGSAAEIAALQLDDNGQLLDDAPLKALLAGDFAPLVGSEALEGAPTAAPPADTGGYTSKKEIMAIQDRQKRRTAIAANLNLF